MAEETKAKKPMDLQALAKKLNTGKGMKNTAKQVLNFQILPYFVLQEVLL